MTIGEKINYLRKQKGITQTEFARLTGIHQVSLSKYEKDKMIPRPGQLRKIVEAFGVSPMIFFDDNSFAVKTRGDLIGLLINLCKSGVLVVKGKRDRNGALIPRTVTFEFAPNIAKLFAGKVEEKISFEPDEPLLTDFIKWEKQFRNYEKMYKKYASSDSRAEISTLDELRDTIEKIEIELQCSAVVLK